MSWLQVVVLALVQGLTEFLPISSSAHLLIPSEISAWPDQGLAFDVAVHLGTLFAVLWYFRRDLIELSTHWFKHGCSQQQTTQSRLAWCIVIATIPVLIAGFFLKDFIEVHLRSAAVIAWATLLFGVLLGIADIISRKQLARSTTATSISWKTALCIGIAQVFALIPGTSRSGVTMTAALFAGLDRKYAARFSFLLSIPVISAASLIYSYELWSSPLTVVWEHFVVGMLISAITAYFCIHWFLAWIEKIGFMPFVWYRIVLAMILFAVILL